MLKIFFSYSHNDEDFRSDLKKHLMPLEREGKIKPWYDREIIAGEELENKISENLESANIILLLISSDFIASEYCFCKEMTRAMERHEAGKAIVIPIILHPCDWQKMPFGKLMALPNDGKAISTFPNKHDALLEIAKGIRKVTEKFDKKSEEKTKETSTAYFNSTFPDSYNRTNTDQEIKNIVSNNIDKILNNEIMICIEKSLKKRIENKSNKTVTRVSDELVNLPVLDALVDLEKTLEECFDLLSIHAANKEALRLQWQASLNILGWLLLLAVSPEWRMKHKSIFEEKKTMNFKLSVTTKSSADIAVSCLLEKPVGLSDNKSSGFDKACDFGIELGINKADSAAEITKAIYRAVYKTSGDVKPGYLDDLRARLRAHNYRNEHRYVAVDISDAQNPLNDAVVYQQLITILPELNLIYLGAKDADLDVLLIPERDVIENIELFMKKRPMMEGV